MNKTHCWDLGTRRHRRNKVRKRTQETVAVKKPDIIQAALFGDPTGSGLCTVMDVWVTVLRLAFVSSSLQPASLSAWLCVSTIQTVAQVVDGYRLWLAFRWHERIKAKYDTTCVLRSSWAHVPSPCLWSPPRWLKWLSGRRWSSGSPEAGSAAGTDSCGTTHTHTPTQWSRDVNMDSAGSAAAHVFV